MIFNKKKTFRDLANATLLNKETSYTLRVTSNKRNLVYEKNLNFNKIRFKSIRLIY